MNKIILNTIGTPCKAGGGGNSGGGNTGGAKLLPEEYYRKYYTIEALEDDFTISGRWMGIEYCVDGNGEWIELAAQQLSTPVQKGQKISIRANATEQMALIMVTDKKQFNAEGDILSLYYGDNAASATSMPNRAFRSFFYGANIVSAEKLRLPNFYSEYCYDEMFRDCKLLEYCPPLPRADLAEGCFSSMFYGCINLKRHSQLPTKVMTASYAHQRMFENCTSLREGIVPVVKNSKDSDYQYMYSGCSSLDFFKYEAPVYTWMSVMNIISGASDTGVAIIHNKVTDEEMSYMRIPEGWTIVRQEI